MKRIVFFLFLTLFPFLAAHGQTIPAGLELFRAAKQAGAQLVITHHGLLWGKEERLTGTFGARVAYLCKNDLALAAYHLPLDMHPVIGHNACLIKKLGAQNPQI